MIQNGDYSLSNEIDNTKQNRGKSQDYWLKKFSGEFVRNNFHYDYKENVPNVRIIDSVDFRFSGKIFSELMGLSNGSDTKLFKILTAGLVVILGRTTFTQSGIKDVTVGTPVLFKQRKGIETKPTNTVLALRNQFEENIKFKELVTKVGKTIDEAQEHKYFPVEKIPGQLKMQVFGDDFPLFDVAISLENIQDRRYIRHLNVNVIFSFFKTARYIDGVVEYNASLYKRATIKKIVAHFTNFLRLSLKDINGEVGVSDIDILSEEEKQQLLYDFSGGDVDYPKDLTIQELFQNHVEKVPGKIALVFENSRMSYNELNRRANRVAWLLREKNVGTDGVVPMMVERSIEAVVAIMGIIKVGAGYLPIVVDNPKERIRGILNDSDAKVMVTRKKYAALAEFTGEAIHMEDESLFEGDSSNPPVVTSPQGLMYVIYTSGSTGKPKGVMLNQGNLINLLFFQWEEIGVDFSGRILQFASIGFDVSAQEIFSTLLGQGTLHLTSDEQKHDAPRLFKYIQKNYVETIFIPPAFLKFVFSDSGIAEKFPVCIKHIIAAGEQLIVTEGLQTYLRKHKAFLHNHYGPTESHVVTTLKMGPKGEIPEAPSIGKPITNNNILILGRDNYIMQPMGITGELYITGVNVARGYSNRPELTHERFMMNPYKKKERMYRTGDLARWLPDGNIDFLGRIDFQVKIRGFRIEIGEIESQLLRYEKQKIKEVVVLAREESSGGDKYLCAYIVSDEKIDTNALNNSLSRNLPDYMIPSYFVLVDKIPLNPNGKVDWRKLPDPKSLGRQERYVPPRNDVEKALVDIWAQVLQMKKDIISIDDNFFRLGGHSLKAAVMITKIRKELQVKISMNEIFDRPTILKMGDYIKSAKKEEFAPIGKASERKYYPQVSAQKRLYFLYQLDPRSTVYNIQLMDVYCKGIDLQRLEQAFKKLIQRHESLRTSFWTVNGESVQKVHDFAEVNKKIEIEYWETAEGGMIYSEEEGKEWTKVTGLPFQDVVEHFVRCFDLTRPPLIRAGLIKIYGNTQILMLDMHHIISDGVSELVIIKELWELYDGEELPTMTIQYKDFVEWAIERVQSEDVKKQEAYWLKEFAGEISPLNLPTDYPRPAVLNFDGDTLQFEVDNDETHSLNIMGQEQGATLYMVLIAIYNVLLAKLSGQEEVIIGTVSAGRNHADLQNLVGMFVDTLVLRNYPEEKKTFEEFLEEVKERTINVFENQEYPFEELVSKVAPNHDRNRNPLFDVAFGLENEAERSDVYLLEVLMLDKTKLYTYDVKKSKFDMMLIGADTPGGLVFQLEYSTSLFKLETIERFARYFKKIVTSICKDVKLKIAEIEIISQGEKNQVLYEFNNRKQEYPRDKTIMELFESCAAKTPDNIALTYKGDTLNYRQVNEKANQLARKIREKGIKPDNTVGIMVERSLEMIIGVFAILKAGGAYLPIDPAYPEDRVHYLLKDSASKLLLTQSKFLEFAGTVDFEGEVLNLDDKLLYQGESEDLQPVNWPGDLAYIIYTSGSTGLPKGVMIEHVSAVNLLFTLDRVYPLEASDVYLLKTAFLFDVSVSELFGWFWRGGRLAILEPGGEKDPLMMIDKIQEEKVTHINFVPSMFNIFVSMLDNKNIAKLSALKYIFLAGEAIWADSIIKFRALNTEITIENLYGPTEATVYASLYPVGKWEGLGSIPIGIPVDNSKLYILSSDEHARPGLQPVGVAGELTISGIGLARGYLNRQVLTAEKFVDNSFAKYAGLEPFYHKLYRTGDLCRWFSDGNVEYMGRIDFQVKVRGFRIELGEIETQLLTHENIKEAVVIARQEREGEKYLCAYLVSDEQLDISSIRDELSNHLPGYMVPSYFVQLDKIPLTPSGKVDRKLLPVPETAGIATRYIAPRDEIEKILADIWAEVLGAAQIGIDENFFEVGGDSIKTILISSRLLKRGLSININDFYSNNTIRKLAKLVKKMERVIPQGIVIGEVELTPIQQWLFQEHLPYSHHFNQSILLYSKAGFEENVLKEIFTKIVSHHDALRMEYEFENDIIRQQNRGILEKLFDLEVIQLTKKGKKEIMAEIQSQVKRIQQSIDLQNGPLVKLGLFKGRDGDYLSMVIHHLVIDGVSWRILLEDLDKGFIQVEKGKEISFQDKTDSFQYWARQLKNYAQGARALKELDYWQEIEEIEIKSLPVDHPVKEDHRKYKDNAWVEMTLTKEKTGQLLGKVNWAYNTEINDILLTALGLAVNQQWPGMDKVLINMEGHGREQIIEDADISRTVGWFTTQYPIILDMEHSGDLSLIIRSVKEILRRIPNKGIGYGILKYLTPDEMKKNIRFKHTPEIVFNYLGLMESESYTEIDDIYGLTDLNFGASAVNQDFNVDYKIDIEGSIGNGKLCFLIYYDKHEYNREIMENLAEKFKFHLEKIIHHCIEREESQITPSDVGYNKISIDNFQRLIQEVKIRVADDAEIQLIYPLSSMQSGMLYHSLENKGSYAYFEQMMLTLYGDINPSLLELALNKLVERYDVLRTIFTYEGMDESIQIVLKARKAQLYYKDLTHLSEDEQVRYLSEFKEKDKARGFDLTADLLIRLCLFKTGSNTHQLVWSFQHIIMDGWCLGIVFKELSQIYQWLKEEKEITLEPEVPYVNYIKWLEKQDEKEGLGFWEKYLADFEDPTSLPKPPGIVKESEYLQKEYFFDIDEELTAGINEISGKSHVTVNTVFQTIWGILLHKYNHVNDVVFGVVVSGRPSEIAGVESMVGLFINSIPIRIKPSEEQEFVQLLSEVQDGFASTKPYEYLPTADIQSTSSLKGDLFDHILVFENYPIQEEVKSEGEGQVTGFNVGDVEFFEQTSYNFNVIFTPGTCIKGTFNYNALVYDMNLIENIALHFINVVRQIESDPQIEISKIEIITDDEKKLILDHFNATESDYPGDKTINELFEAVVNKYPGNRAVVGTAHGPWGTQLTYKELNVKVNQLAAVLRSKGIQPEDAAAIMVEPCQEMIIGLMGILKAGGAFLPIDHNIPADRIKYILEESGTQYFLTRRELLKGMIYKGEIISLDNNDIYKGKEGNLPHVNTPADMAYIIYTSGSTGKPKGVVVEHRSLINLCFWHNKYYSVTHAARATKYAGFGFDASVWEVFPYLVIGAALYIVPEEIKLDIEKLNRYYEDNGITISFLPTQMCEQFMTVNNRSLRVLLTGGDKLRTFTEKNYQLYNNYGPTENTVVTTSCPVNELTTNIPIGKPLDNNQIYILSRSDNLQPILAAGELCIGGDSLARGYLNNPVLTLEKFVQLKGKSWLPAPVTIYRTGDLSRWLWNEDIEFLGRIDYQVKIRGFRIEIGEIETQLLDLPGIKEAVVIAKEDPENPGEKYLSAFIVGQSPEKIDIAVVRSELSKNLPDYMIPSYFIQLNEIPLTPSGKVDRKKLAAEEHFVQIDRQYTPPRNEVEELVADAWQKILKIEKISIHDNFFQRGGNSIKAIQLVSLLIKNFDVAIAHIFKYNTLVELAENIMFKKDNIQQKIVEMRDALDPVRLEKQHRIHLQKLEEEKKTYLKKIEQEQFADLGIHRDYKHILVTGATGYLGAHLVLELLKNTRAELYLLVRGNTHEEAEERLKNRLIFYFGHDFVETNMKRVRVIRGNLREDNLGFDQSTYQSLSQQVDAVVHSAANVKHVGLYEEFYEDNVNATERLLKFSLTGKTKDFHYISTLSVCWGKIEDKDYIFYNEYSPHVGQKHDHVYVRTKFEGEQKILEYREKGLNASIYRVGNLMFQSGTGKFQENIEENAFYTNLKAFLSLGIVPESYEPTDLSFIDYSARAVVLLLTRKNLVNETFHLNNVYLLNWKEMGNLLKSVGMKIQVVSHDEFFDYLLDHMDNIKFREEVNRFLLHSGFFESKESKETFSMVESSRTVHILDQIGFEWPKVTKEHIEKMIVHCNKVGFL